MFDFEESSYIHLVHHYCPRLTPWQHYSLDSLLHPNTSSTVMQRKLREEAFDTFLAFDQVSQLLKQCNTKSPPTLTMEMLNRMAFMTPENRWLLLGTAYEACINEEQNGLADHIQSLISVIHSYEGVSQLIYLWWGSMCNRRRIIDRATLLLTMVKIYDELIPYPICSPAEKVSAIQEDIKHILKSSRIVHYNHVQILLMTICDNWVNMNTRSYGVGDNVLQTPISKAVVICERYVQFLKRLHSVVFPDTSSNSNSKSLPSYSLQIENTRYDYCKTATMRRAKSQNAGRLEPFQQSILKRHKKANSTTRIPAGTLPPLRLKQML